MDLGKTYADPLLTVPTRSFSALAGGPQFGATRAAGKNGDVDAVREAALQFEAVFLSQMMAPMFESLSTDGLFGGGQSEQVYRSMMVEEYGKAIVQSGGIGLADAVQREMIRIQETQS